MSEGRIALLTLAFFLLPFIPAVGLVVGLFAVLIHLRSHSLLRAEHFRRVWPLLFVVLALTISGIVAEAFALKALPGRLPSWLERIAVPTANSVGYKNLISNRDLSWLVGYSPTGGRGPYAGYVGDGFWRLSAVDIESGVPFTEFLTAKEIPVSSSTPYVLSLEVRHDGEFDATLMFRTRTASWRAETTKETLQDGWERLSAVYPQMKQDQRLRAMHLVDLRGDYSYLDVGRAQLLPGTQIRPYVPASGPEPMASGLFWWFGTGAVMVIVVLWAAIPHSSSWMSSAAIGLVGANVAQASLGAIQLASGAQRATGTLGDPNLFGHVAVITAFAAVAMADGAIWKTAVAIPAAALAVVASGSLGAALGLAIGAIGLFAFLPLRTYRVAAGLIAVAGVLTALLVAIGGPPPWLDSNITSRVQSWQSALKFSTHFPLTGVGHRNFEFFNEFMAPFGYGPQFLATHAHSLLNIGAESGIVVLSILVGGCVLLLVRLIRVQRFAALLLIVVLVLNLTDWTLFNSAIFIPVWLVVAMAWSGTLSAYSTSMQVGRGRS